MSNENFEKVMRDMGLWDDYNPDYNSCYEDGIDYGHIEYWQNICCKMADRIIELERKIKNAT
jgi:hypothetical protein